jgi:ABC-type amino acid transport substrate-binding protein
MRGLSSDGDWLFGSGKANYTTFNDAILLNISTVLKTFLGECFFNTEAGQNWFTLINQKNVDIIVLSIKSAIYECYGVMNVTEVEYSFDVNRVFEIKYNIDTLYSKNVRGTVTI